MKKTHRMTPTPLAIAALAAAAGALAACGDLKNNTIPVDRVSYRPDGSLVMFTPAGIEIYDGRLLAQINHIPLDALAVPPFIGEFSYSLSADGTVAAVAYSPNPTISTEAAGMNTRVAIYRIPDGAVLSQFELADAPPPSSGHGIYSLEVSPDGTHLYSLTEGYGGKAMVVDTATGAPLWTDDGGGRIQTIWSADGTTLFALTEDQTSLYTLEALDAQTGGSRWMTDPSSVYVRVLALVGDGALLTGPGDESFAGTCQNPGDCPPDYPLLSVSDGSLTARLPPAPHTTFTAIYPSTSATFACNATNTCAIYLSEFTPIDPPPTNSAPWVQSWFIRVYGTDGTELQRLQHGDTIGNSMAVSPDGKFVTFADSPGVQGGGVTVLSVDDGSVVGSHAFTTETF